MRTKNTKVLCRIGWVIKFQLSTGEIYHVDEVVYIPVPPCPFFGQLDLWVDALQYTVAYPALYIVYYPAPVCPYRPGGPDERFYGRAKRFVQNWDFHSLICWIPLVFPARRNGWALLFLQYFYWAQQDQKNKQMSLDDWISVQPTIFDIEGINWW